MSYYTCISFEFNTEIFSVYSSKFITFHPSMNSFFAYNHILNGNKVKNKLHQLRS